MPKRLFLLWIICSTFVLNGRAQRIKSIATLWSDSFREWVIYTDDEDITGFLRLQWATGDDWSSWTYQVGEHYGVIQQKWSNDPSQWELRGDNEIITARTIWRDDFTAWNCDDGTTRIKWKSVYKNILEDWVADSPSGNINCELYVAWEGDPREWMFENNSEEELSFAYQMMLIFITIYHATPKD